MTCTAGPHDRPFEEYHAWVRIAIVVSGTFQYRSESSRELLTPGSLLLGNSGRSFECSHEHATGDRCISFGYSPDYFARLANRPFRRLRIPPLRDFSPLVARACEPQSNWEEIGVRLAARAADLAGDDSSSCCDPPASAIRRVTQIVRDIESSGAAPLPLSSLASASGLSLYHFLRTFERVTGVTPHQYLLRSRLRDAATRLRRDDAKVIDVALDCGFGDLSNFNRAFRREFGVGPRAWRKQNLTTEVQRAESSVLSLDS